MPDHLITCPNPACAQPLNLPGDAIGKPLSCPHCLSALNVTLTETGEVSSVAMARKSGMNVPRQFLVPGFALLILGLAGVFVNGYIALKCRTDDGFALRYSRHRAEDFRDGGLGAIAGGKSQKEVSPDDLFGALAGSAASAGKTADEVERVALGWEPWIYPSRYAAMGLGAITALGGFCILRGRGYGAALLGCVAAVLNINELGCCFPGGIAGVWGILMLVRDDGRRYFRIAPRAGR